MHLLRIGGLLLWGVTRAYLPGVAPTDYAYGDRVELKVNSLTSVKSQIPLPFYSLPFCVPPTVITTAENLGEVLLGERLENSVFEFRIGEPQSCKLLCRVDLTEEDRTKLTRAIDEEYRVNWLVDNLPVAVVHEYLDGDPPLYFFGFPLGVKLAGSGEDGSQQQPAYYLHNYFRFTIKYNSFVDTNGNTIFRIVGVEMVPNSLKPSGDEVSCAPDGALNLMDGNKVVYMYDVDWVESDTPWAARWASFIEGSHEYTNSPSVRWFSIVNSLVVVLLLFAIIAMILLRTLHKDISRYNQGGLTEEDIEETGWKLVHGDVFRKPAHSTILAALVGSGVQVLGMVLVTVVFSCLGIFSPALRGRMVQGALLLWGGMGGLAGYTASRFYKTFKSSNWKMTVVRTSLMYPGVVFGIFFLVNVALLWNGSSAAVPFATIVTLCVLWFGVSTPLVFVGAYLGDRQAPISFPGRVNKIPRQIPEQNWLMHPLISCLAGGALPFGAVFTELFFVFASIWQHRYYQLFGLLFLVMMILIVICAEISIAIVYFQLVCEDYRWWWRSFFAAGTSGLYVFAYSIVYMFTKLHLTRLASVVLYVGYSFLIAYSFMVMTGAIGFMASFFFVRAIYGSIRVD